ncbi:hypothetical protein WME99_50625 [Sorangium sp. So ce136]
MGPTGSPASSRTMWLAALGTKVSLSSWAVSNTPILLEPRAAT